MNARIQASVLSSGMAQVSPYGFPMEVSYEYDAGEPPTFGSLDIAHPGWPSSVQILSCLVGGVDIVDMLTPKQQDRIEDAIKELIE